ncbi:MAG: LptE family protein [Acidobacteriota bacterium]
MIETKELRPEFSTIPDQLRPGVTLRGTVAWMARLGLAAGLVTVAACGYHLVGRSGSLPEGVTSVGVPVFENRSRQPEVAQRFTEQVIEELSARSSVRILPGPEGADALLRGVISGYESTPVLLSPEGRARRYEVTVTASVRLEDLRHDRTLWANDQFVFRRQYDVPEDESFFDQQIVAIETVAREFAESVVTAMLEGF